MWLPLAFSSDEWCDAPFARMSGDEDEDGLAAALDDEFAGWGEEEELDGEVRCHCPIRICVLFLV